MNAPAPAPAAVREHRLEIREVLEGLLADGMIRPDQIRELLIKLSSRREERHPLVVVAECDWENLAAPGRRLTLEALMQWMAARARLPYLRIDPLSIDVSRITSIISYAYAARIRILPVKVTATEVTIATAEPYWRDWERELSRVLKQRIERVVASPLDIDRYLIEFYALARSVKASVEERGKNPAVGVQNLEQLMELGRAGKLEANDQHVVSIVDWLLNYAFQSRASDIHLEPRRTQGNVRFRIDGVLHEVYQLPPTVMSAVTSRIKILGRMDVAEKRKPQDGRIKTRSPEGKEVELRVSSLPTAFGEKLVMRIFDPEVLVKDFADLGFEPDDAAIWQEMIQQPSGIILVTGPTGSGKTTTLYSTLKQLATSDVNVCTIEDPIELMEPAFNQMQVHAAIDLTFASGVRALLRQDPDIIMVGEIRDLETAENAIQAALTGHLVLSTLHTNDAPSAVTRLMELGVRPYLIKATLIGVVAQRLLRRLCKHCKAPMQVNASSWHDLIGDSKLPRPEQACQPVGCLECRETGYLGRAGIYEILQLTPEIKNLIRPDIDVAGLRETAIKQGMTPLRLAGAHKVMEGQTSVDEVLRTSPAAQGGG